MAHNLRSLRDLGLAFASVLIRDLHSVSSVRFQSFKTLIAIMAAIPFSLVGILLGHWLMEHVHRDLDDRFHSGRGIVVRN